MVRGTEKRLFERMWEVLVCVDWLCVVEGRAVRGRMNELRDRLEAGGREVSLLKAVDERFRTER